MLHLVSGGVTTACAEPEDRRFKARVNTVKDVIN
jgi:hypothetical protein